MTLKTAIIDVVEGSRIRKARATLDSGSSISLITEELASSLKLKRTYYPITILGLTEKTTTSKNYVSVRLQSSSNPNSSIKITCSLVPKITTSTPPLSPIAILTDPLLQDKAPVADPSLGGKVDILLGAHHTDLSKAMATKRFHQNERTLKKKGIYDRFKTVLSEYLELDHAEPVPDSELQHPQNPTYYLPVQGVVRESSTTTKLRAVFDASARTSNGTSLNDTLLTGPTMYPLLSDVLIRFRNHAIGFSADIGKRFREIVLHPEERDLHRFLRRDEADRIQICRMKRLTFGVRSSPFLATQTIRHLAETHRESHPNASQSILQDFYVDDFLSGSSTIDKADALRVELCSLLQSAGMTLRKWRTNSTSFRDTIHQDLIETADLLHLPKLWECIGMFNTIPSMLQHQKLKIPLSLNDLLLHVQRRYTTSLVSLHLPQ